MCTSPVGARAAPATDCCTIWEVVIVGALDHLEIWAPSAWQPYRAKIEDAPEELAAHLQDLGI